MSKIAVIVGAGLATRLHPISSVIPKVLVNWYNDPILTRQIAIYNEMLEADEVWVLVPQDKLQLVERFLEEYGYVDKGVYAMGIDKPNGSAYAISELNKVRALDGENVVFNWSDVIAFPSGKTKLFSPKGFWKQDVVYTYGNESRYRFEDGILGEVGKTGGNVIGVYQFRDFKCIDSEGDLVEVYDLSNHKGEDLGLVIDLGDMKKLKESHEFEPISRSFNQVEMFDDYVVKKALTEDARALQQNEIAWYYESLRNPQSNIVSPTRLLSSYDDQIVLERVKGRSLCEIQGPLLKSYVHDLVTYTDNESRFYEVDEQQIHRDYYLEFVQKVINRNNSIRWLIDSVSQVKVINNIRIELNESTLIAETFDKIMRYVPNEYFLIHGDPNFSNVIVREDETLALIDPRGYFGKTKLYGPKDYDKAKYMYACSGYDKFNKQPDWAGLTIEGDHAYVDVEPLMDNWEQSLFFDRVHRYMTGVIWMALAGYFKNNPYKSIAAYLYGTYLMRKVL